MIICGLNKTTLLDYPEHVAATIFTGGCNFRCPFCHNASLLGMIEKQRQIPEEEILAFLSKRAGILEGVCVTGGEPTLQPDLESFLVKVKELGYLIKLDSNGSKPEVLKNLVSKGLVDYVAMDVKASMDNYERLIGISSTESSTILPKIRESIEFLLEGTIPYEFRTTAVKGLHNIEEFEKIGKWIAGARAYFIQNYRDDGEVLVKGYDSFSVEELEQMRILAHKYIDRAEVRGVN